MDQDVICWYNIARHILPALRARVHTPPNLHLFFNDGFSTFQTICSIPAKKNHLQYKHENVLRQMCCFQVCYLNV